MGSCIVCERDRNTSSFFFVTRAEIGPADSLDSHVDEISPWIGKHMDENKSTSEVEKSKAKTSVISASSRELEKSETEGPIIPESSREVEKSDVITPNLPTPTTKQAVILNDNLTYSESHSTVITPDLNSATEKKESNLVNRIDESTLEISILISNEKVIPNISAKDDESKSVNVEDDTQLAKRHIPNSATGMDNSTLVIAQDEPASEAPFVTKVLNSSKRMKEEEEAKSATKLNENNDGTLVNVEDRIKNSDKQKRYSGEKNEVDEFRKVENYQNRSHSLFPGASKWNSSMTLVTPDGETVPIIAHDSYQDILDSQPQSASLSGSLNIINIEPENEYDSTQQIIGKDKKNEKLSVYREPRSRSQSRRRKRGGSLFQEQFHEIQDKLKVLKTRSASFSPKAKGKASSDDDDGYLIEPLTFARSVEESRERWSNSLLLGERKVPNDQWVCSEIITL